MVPRNGSTDDGARRFVVLSSGWSGESVLARLLSAGGTVRIVGEVLDRPVRRPARHLRDALCSGADGRVRGAIVQPHHLWLLNGLDATAFVADLVGDGVVVVSLRRASHIDRGLSRALCGPIAEVLPLGPVIVDPGEVAVFSAENELAAQWFDEVVPDPELRLVFEDHLTTEPARAATAARVAGRLSLSAPPAPPEHALPTDAELWRRVADAAALREQVDALFGGTGG